MILPMIVAAIALGKSFRMDIMAPHNFIFVQSEIEAQKVVIEDPFTRSEYKMIESAADVNDFLNMEGELSLFLKSNKISISGTGEYLTKKVDRTKTVEILLKVNTQQKIETLPTYVPLQKDWESTLGSHFIRSIIYGGTLLVTYQMTSDSSENIEEIKAVVNANLETSGSINLEVKGKLEKISKDLTGKCETRVHAYYTGGIFSQPTDLESAFKLMEEFPSKFEAYTKSEGNYIPIAFDLESLSTLSSKFERRVMNRTRNEILDEAIDKYDDAIFAYSESKSWFPWTSDGKLEEQVQKFKARVVNAKEALDAAIGDLDLGKPFDVHHFDKAFAIYAVDGINIPNRYTRELNCLRNAEKKIVPEWYGYTRAVNEYIHWGNVNCSLPSPDPVLVGVAASSPLGFGSGSDIQCLGVKPGFVDSRLTADTKRSVINGLNFQAPYFDGKQAGEQDPRPLLCARCLLENATAVVMVPARTQCPAGTKLEYKGFLATGLESVTDPICIDKNPVDHHKDIVVGSDATSNSIMPLRLSCPKCEFAEENVHYVPCVVCSR